MSDGSSPPKNPNLAWRATTSFVMSATGLISRAFLFGANTTEVHGLDDFLRILDQRKDVVRRDRGLITVSNHVSVIDDPLIWGALPSRYLLSPPHLRWSLGSYDIVFKNKALSTFFTLGQVLPTHRLAHSPHGGLFQPTMSECIRLLSRPVPSAPYAPSVPNTHDPPDPFSDPTTAPTIYYSTTGTDSFRSPSLCHPHLNAHSWIHIFPEGRIHQHPTRALRYFKWGIARLILESEPLPQVVPIWIEGLDGVMHESRGPPRWVPRIGQDVKVVFGKEVDGEGLFGGLRKEWRELVERDGKQAADEEEREGMESKSSLEKKMSEERLGADLSPRLKYGDDAVKLRIEVSRRVREEIVKLRRGMGWPDEDPKAGLAETWRVEGDAGKRDGRMEDGSWVRDV